MNPPPPARIGLCRKSLVALAFAAALAACGTRPAATEAAAVTPDLERGRLLYENTCNTCHTTQPHWRDKRLVKQWSDLVAQVERWENVARAGWTPQEIQEVASYLNATFYHLPCDACGGPRARR